METLSNFPKIECPFIRKTFEINRNDWREYGQELELREPQVYLVTNEINPGYEWVFEDKDVIASEKLNGCLYYSTSVMTSIGPIPIGKIVNKKLDVQVLSYNFNKQISEFKRIKYYHKEKNTQGFLIVKIKPKYHGTFPNNIVVTPNHKFWTRSGWKKASVLKSGETVFHLTKNLDHIRQQIILGCLLGDSSVYWGGRHKNCGFNGSHSISQTNYFDLKLKLLGNIITECKGSKGGFVGSKRNRRFNSMINNHISDFLKDACLVDGKKIVNTNWVNKLNPIALAFWYLDDGSIVSENNKTQRASASFATNSFSIEEVTLLQKRLLDFGIESNIQNSKTSKGNILRLTADGSDIFFNLIAPYVIKEMQYKLPEQLRSGNSYWDSYTPKEDNDLIETKVISISLLNKNNWRKNIKYQYDLEIEDNPNYFAHQILVHNSNVKLKTENGRLISLMNRKNLIDPLQIMKGKTFIIEGVFRAVQKGYIEENGEQAGEMIGPKIQSNPYNLDNHIWYPFTKAVKHLSYRSFYEHDRTFDNWSSWFKDYLISRFAAKLGEKNVMAEGIVFYSLKRKAEGKTYMAKLRRNMYEWFYSDKIKIYGW